MKNLTLNLESEIALLSKYRITSTELMFIRTLILLQEENNENIFEIYIDSLHKCKIGVREIILSLQDKEIILKSYKCPPSGEAFDPYLIPFNKNFKKTLYKSSFEMGQELFETFPQFGNINGSVVPLRSVARKFNSLEECYFRYGQQIKWNEEIHKEIIELINWANTNNIINCSLATFVINRGWLDLKALKNGDNVNINYNSVKLL